MPMTGLRWERNGLRAALRACVVMSTVFSAPVFAQVMQGALRLLNVPHDAPVVPLELPGETDFAKEST